MFRPPDVADVMAVAGELGMRLSPEEAGVYRTAIQAQLRIFSGFYDSQVEEDRLGAPARARDPGRAPAAEENPYNAWIWRCRIEGADQGPLKGRTVGLKDHIPVAALPLTFGSYSMRDFISDFDAPVVTRLLAAGATITGKLNMDDFSCGGWGWNGVGDFGRVLNPHDPGHITGGSSSGATAALAAGECDIAIGGDQGGSVRIPAAWCGVIGLKPTAGLVPHTGVIGSDPSLDRIGPMARTVRDVAATLEAIAGPDGYDLRQLGSPAGFALEGLDAGVRGMRLGLLRQGVAEPIEPDVRELFGAAVDVLRDQGAEIVEVDVPLHSSALPPYMVLSAEGSRLLYDTRFLMTFSRYYPRRLLAELTRASRPSADGLPHLLKLRYLVAEFSRQACGPDIYAKAHNARLTFTRAYDRVLADVDALLMPTMTFKAPRHEPSADWLESVTRTLGIFGFGRYSTVQNTAPFNYTGHPALTIPCGKSQGLPVALQVVGRFFDESTVLRVAAAYEAAAAEAVGLAAADIARPSG